jgi:hypothetical protein
MPVAYLTGTREFWSLTLECHARPCSCRGRKPRSWSSWPCAQARNDPCSAPFSISAPAAARRARHRLRAAQLERHRRRHLARRHSMSRENARALEIFNVEWRWARGSTVCGERFDLIVANPPYVAGAIRRSRTQGRTRARADAGPTGLEALAAIIAQAPPRTCTTAAGCCWSMAATRHRTVARCSSAAGHLGIRTCRFLQANPRHAGNQDHTQR